MFNMGFTEILVLGLIALVVIGPKQLPEVAKTLARLINELKRATGDLGSTFSQYKNEAQKAIDETRDLVDPMKYLDDSQHPNGEHEHLESHNDHEDHYDHDDYDHDHHHDDYDDHGHDQASGSTAIEESGDIFGFGDTAVSESDSKPEASGQDLEGDDASEETKRGKS